MNKKTQTKKTQNTQDSKKKKRRRLLAIWIPVGTVALAGAVTGIVLGVKSCNKKDETGLDIEYVTKDANLGTYTTKGGLNQDTTITFSPKSGYQLDPTTVKVTVDGKEVPSSLITISGNSITIKAAAVTGKTIKVIASAKETTPVVVVTSMTVTGFKDTVKDSELKETDLKVVLSLQGGATKELDFATGYKLEVSKNGSTFEEITSLPYTFDQTGVYAFKVTYKEDTSFSQNATVNVFAEATDHDVQLNRPGEQTMVITGVTDKISITNNTIKIESATSASKQPLKGRFVAFVEHTESSSNDSQIINLATTDYLLWSSGEEKTNIEIPVTSWSSVVSGETIYVEFEELDVFVNYLGTSKLDNEGIKTNLNPGEFNCLLDDFDHTISFEAWTETGNTAGYFQIWNDENCERSAAHEDARVIFESQYFTFTKDTHVSVNIEFPLDKKDLIYETEKAKIIGIKFIPTKMASVQAESTTDIQLTAAESEIINVEGQRTINVTGKTLDGTTHTGSLVATYTSETDSTEYQVGVKTNVTLTSTTSSNLAIEASDWTNIPSTAGEYIVKVSFIKDQTNITSVVKDTSWSTYGLTATSITQSVNMSNPTITIEKLISSTYSTINHITLTIGYTNASGTWVEVARKENIDASILQTITIDINNWTDISKDNPAALTIKATETMKSVIISPSASLPSDFLVSFQDNDSTWTQKVGEETQKHIYVHTFEGAWWQKGTFYLTRESGERLGTGTVKTFISGTDADITLTIGGATSWEYFGYGEKLTLNYEADTTFKQGRVLGSGAYPSGIEPWFEHKLWTSDDTDTKELSLKSDRATKVNVWIKSAGGASQQVAQNLNLTVTVWNKFTFTLDSTFWSNFVDKSELILVVEEVQ